MVDMMFSAVGVGAIFFLAFAVARLGGVPVRPDRAAAYVIEPIGAPGTAGVLGIEVISGDARTINGAAVPGAERPSGVRLTGFGPAASQNVWRPAGAEPAWLLELDDAAAERGNLRVRVWMAAPPGVETEAATEEGRIPLAVTDLEDVRVRIGSFSGIGGSVDLVLSSENGWQGGVTIGADGKPDGPTAPPPATYAAPTPNAYVVPRPSARVGEAARAAFAEEEKLNNDAPDPIKISVARTETAAYVKAYSGDFGTFGGDVYAVKATITPLDGGKAMKDLLTQVVRSEVTAKAPPWEGRTSWGGVAEPQAGLAVRLYAGLPAVVDDGVAHHDLVADEVQVFVGPAARRTLGGDDPEAARNILTFAKRIAADLDKGAQLLTGKAGSAAAAPGSESVIFSDKTERRVVLRGIGFRSIGAPPGTRAAGIWNGDDGGPRILTPAVAALITVDGKETWRRLRLRQHPALWWAPTK